MSWQRDDEDNVGAGWKIAREVFKSPAQVMAAKNRYTNPILQSKLHVIVQAGEKEFTSHEDVMAKLLGMR